MKQSEEMGILLMFEVAFPAYYAKQTTESKKMMLALMAEMFGELDYELVSVAAKKAMAEDSAFPPSLGHLMSLCEDIKASVRMAMVSDARLERVPAVREYISGQAEIGRQEMMALMAKKVGIGGDCEG